MQRREAKNPPKKLLMPAETERPERYQQISRRNGLFGVFLETRGSVGLDGGVRSQIRTGLDLKFPVKGPFAGNFREKPPVR